MRKEWKDTKLNLTGYTVSVNGRSQSVTLTLECETDQCVDWNREVKEFTDSRMKAALAKRDIARGDLSICWVCVTAHIQGVGIDGSDGMGGVWVRAPSDVDSCIVENGMIDNALDEAVGNLKRMLQAMGLGPVEILIHKPEARK